MVVRTGPQYYQKALAKHHTRPMDFTGKPMKGFVYVGYDGCKTEKTLSEWVDAGLCYVSTLAKAN